jgi:DNA processing protein
VVFAVPGRVDSPLSQGANALIRDGAILAQDLDDILEHLGEVGSKMAPAAPTAADSATAAALDSTERVLFDALAGGAMGLDELVRHTGIDSGKAAGAMTMLVLKGLVAQQPGNIFCHRTHRARQAPGTAPGG